VERVVEFSSQSVFSFNGVPQVNQGNDACGLLLNDKTTTPFFSLVRHLRRSLFL
jgi:hypothetical protein